ncbi:bcl-2/adenovirus E1B 19 kDa-interacting protein 2-like protein isoform X5 [Symphalangus syndactylus]|uniref:bcl-2/adenovirus E1B 19 kDa-interacting protein 2-like protein isoform X5 n=1 Tax=Symphalangus syndactylus TaxID=9590 RepID=UPI0030072726
MHSPPQNPPAHRRQGFSFGQTCSWGEEWQNLFEDEVTSLPHLPPWKQELQQLRQKRGKEVLGAGTTSSPTTPRCLKKKAGRLVKMGTIQEAGKKTDVGVREIAEAPELGAALRHGELELKEEWQDEEFPRLLPEEVGLSEDPEDPKGDSQAGTPSTLALCGQRPMRKRLSAPELQLSLTKGPGNDGTSPTQSAPSSPDGSSDLEVDELETPSDSEQLDSGHEFEWEDELPRAEGLGASEAAERLGRGCMWDVAGEEGHHWRVFRMGPREQRVDMTVIDPYKKVLSHGGYGKTCEPWWLSMLHVPNSHEKSVFWTAWGSWPNSYPWIKSTSLKLSDSWTGISMAQEGPSTGLDKGPWNQLAICLHPESLKHLNCFVNRLIPNLSTTRSSLLSGILSFA